MTVCDQKLFKSDNCSSPTYRICGPQCIWRGPMAGPPRSCDLTLLDYFLWGNVKSLVYADMPETIDGLEEYIRLVIADIRSQLLQKVVENWALIYKYIKKLIILIYMRFISS